MRRFVCLVLACLALSLPATAQTYPDYSEIYVNDFADLLTLNDEQTVREKLTELHDKRGIEFTVVTISRMSDYGHLGPIEPFATGLFNHWGVGDAARNDGVMMLVARDDRVMRIEVGSGYADGKDIAMKDIIEGTILPEFRRDEYAAGISGGVDSVIHNLTGSWPGEYDATAAQRAVGWLGRAFDAIGNWIWALIAPLLAIPAQIYRRWKRNHPRTCPRDGSRMTRLDEEWDDNHLQEGQITEEQLKSVDYDVWQCPKCEHVTVEAYKAWFSRYGACRSCGFRTVEGDTTILEPATTSSEGLKQIDYYCHHCHDSYSVTRNIPRKSSSSSSGGSSFGGGSSSGGGASGSW